MAADNAFFGIDLGTTSCSVCCYQTPHDLSFITENTKASLPSVVTCSKTKDTDLLFCQAAEKHSESIICESKRLLGMRYDDPRIQVLVKNKHFDSFALISDRGGRVKVEFAKGGKTLSMYPWKISSMTIRHIHGLICQRFNYDTDAKIKASSASRRTSRTSSAQRRCGQGRLRGSM